jgi:hypothetical protein
MLKEVDFIMHTCANKPTGQGKRLSYLQRLSFIFLGSTLLASNALASVESSQAIQSTVRLTQLQGQPTMWMLIKNMHNGSVFPVSYPINKKNMYQIVKTGSPFYQIVDLNIQFQDGRTIHPCTISSQVIANQATRILLLGSLGQHLPNPECHMSYVNALPLAEAKTPPMVQSTNTTAPQITAPSSSKATTKSSDNPYAAMASYLQDLRLCGKQSYQLTIGSSPLTINVAGKEGDVCKVEIKGKANANCRFTTTDIDTLASDQQIKMYQSGKIDSTPNVGVTAIMQKRCDNLQGVFS